MILLDVCVHADDPAAAFFDGLLELVARSSDLGLRIAVLDRRHHPAHRFDLLQLLAKALFQIESQPFQEVASPERIDRFGHTGLEGQHLLCPQRQQGGLLGRQGVRLVERVGVQRLRSAQNGGQGLNRRTNKIHPRLLGRQRHARRLRVETQLPRTLVLRTEAIPHQPGPDFPCRAELGDLLEEVAVYVEKKAQPGNEAIDLQAALDSPLYVFDSGSEGEDQLLQGRRARLANVIAADRDRVELRSVRGAELQRIDDQTHRRTRRVDVLLLRHILFENVVLDRPRKPRPISALLLGHDEIHGPQDGRRGGDRHGRRHLGQRDAAEQLLHVRQA